MKSNPRQPEREPRTASTRRVLITSIASLLAAHAAFPAEAVFSSGAITGDANSGVSSSKTYTARANVIGGDVTVNGVTFVGSGTALSGTGWDLTGVPNLFGSGGNHTTTFGASVIDNLFDGFQYGGDPGTLTLSGLTAGKTYVATLYNEAWSWPGIDLNRTNAFTSSEGASTLYNPDLLEASVLRYTFVATGPTTTLNFAQTNANYSMHIYGLSNEQVFTNTWSPNSGNSWNTAANWSSGVVPNAAGTNASFSAQAGPTTVSFSQSRTVGHVEFLGTGSYTVTGSTLKLQADAGGTSVLNTAAGGSHTIDALVNLASDTVKFGAGTLTFNQEVFGTKGLSINGGTVRFVETNSYSGGTSVGSGATLDLNGTSQPLGALNGAGTIVNDNSGTSVATVDSGTISGVIRDHNTGSGIVALTKTTNGTLTLSGSQAYTGATTISAGTLRVVGTQTSTTLLTDNFSATGNPDTNDLNFNLANRQTGDAALQSWTPTGPNQQVGNPTFVQQPFRTNGDYLLLAFGGDATLNGLPLSTTNAPGPLKISIDMFKGSSSDATDWVSLTVRAAGGDGFPITGSGEFGFLYRQNTGTQLFNNGGLLQSLTSTTGGDHFEFYLADSAGTGSPFAGNGTKLVITQGGATIGGFILDTGLAANSYITFGSGGTKIGGVDNLSITQSFVNQTNVLLPTANVDLNATGAVFELVDVNQTIATLSGVAGSAVNIGPLSKLTVNATTNSTFSGTITGVLGGLQKDGPSTLELNAASSYGAGTTIAAGTIITHSSGALGTGPVAIAAGANFLPWYNAATPVIANNFTLNGLGGNPGDGNKSAIYADGGGAGYAEYILTGSVTLAATSNISGNNLNNQRILGQITGPGGLTKGSGRADENSALILSNTANDYAGDTTINNGTVKLGASQVIPDGAGKGRVVVSAGATLDLAGNNETINNLSGTGTITTTPAVVIGGPVFFSTNADSGISLTKTYSHSLDFGDGSAATVNGITFEPAANSGANWTLAGATFLLPESAGSPSTPSFPDEPDGTAMNQLLSDFYYNGNPATLTLNGLTPGTNYELRLYERFWGGDRTQLFSFNAGPATGSLIFNQDASTDPNYLSFRYVADASGTATLSTTQLGAGTFHWYGLTNEEVAAVPLPVLTVGDETDSTFSGAITGPLEIDKVGTGVLTLDGALSFATLTVTDGRLNLNSPLDNATIDADGGQLVVNASLTGTTVNVGATNTTYFTEDQTLTELNIAAGGHLVVTDSPVPSAAAGLQAVPEPGSLSLLLMGASALFVRRRRRL